MLFLLTSAFLALLPYYWPEGVILVAKIFFWG